MVVELEWAEFVEKLRNPTCRVEDGKIVCEGIIDDKPAVCEVSAKDGKPQVTCKKFIGEQQPV